MLDSHIMTNLRQLWARTRAAMAQVDPIDEGHFSDEGFHALAEDVDHTLREILDPPGIADPSKPPSKIDRINGAIQSMQDAQAAVADLLPLSRYYLQFAIDKAEATRAGLIAKGAK
jgi:hypothetical protein